MPERHGPYDEIPLEAVTAPVVRRSDVVVVGGGPAGVSAAVAAARRGASVTLLERYAALGGLASGGMVLVLDDMCNGDEITVRGVVSEYVERLDKLGLAVYPPESDRYASPEMWARWGRYGTFDFHTRTNPKPICYAVAFDPDGWKRVSNDLVRESGVHLRLHNWFSRPVVQDGVIRGAVCETKAGPQAVLGDVVVDTTGDIDVASRSGADYVHDRYLVTLVFRLGGVDTATAERFEQRHPREARAINRRVKRMLGGAWELWWLKTPVPGVVWCNCPHLTGFDGADPESLTEAEFEARARIAEVVEYVRRELPGFADCYVVDVAEQIGVRQTRLLRGEYVVTKDDLVTRRHFADTVCRGRDYYTPYRALLPRGVDGLLVAGRHYSATPDAQRMSREIPPCMAMGQAAGIAAAIAADTGVTPREVSVSDIRRGMREQGADPGDVPSADATVAEEVPA
ncbi:FAD-dependent oxidoreductase [Gandjariella thermophila]|uniref:Invasion protein n=1 Tax=Gandjariella thermophila TaxID=1931992 RepID=A0A4D4JEB9_9PSEU|nr:FAD-dependent oxidoreductase [Gandjariella thermophila]GDY32716.1 invasion protein [Gandjariella thermophila]